VIDDANEIIVYTSDKRELKARVIGAERIFHLVSVPPDLFRCHERLELEAFEPAEQIMDRIKEVAPIWKKEIWADGASEWVGNETERKAELDETRMDADKLG